MARREAGDGRRAERIQKALARIGLGSRREIERWIGAGRITVNGRVAVLGDKITVTDRVYLDTDRVRLGAVSRLKTRVIMYHKPAGEVCTRRDPEGRPTVFAALPRLGTGRWIAVGRLDINTTGLLLFTNDGALAQRLTHPSSVIDREYAVRVLGEVDDGVMRRLRQGVALEDGLACFSDIVDAGGEGANHWYHVTLMEGKKREVRRLWESQGVRVSRLIRVRFGVAALPRRLRPGAIKELTGDRLRALLASVA